MTQTDIDRIKDYCAKATNGPWRFALAYKKEHYGPLVAAVAPGHHIQAENCSGGTYPNRDAEFIAQARTDLPAAIAEIERLRDANLLEYNGRLQDGREHRDEIKRLRELLKKAHDAMHSWYSSEYADHPLSMEVSKGLQ